MSDEPVGSYIAAAIPADSIENYVLTMTPAEQRQVVACALTLGKVINNIFLQGNEAAIQQLKLNWWLEETELSAKDEPRHPLTRYLVSAVDHDKWLTPLRTLIRGSFEDVGRDHFATLQECLAYCHRNAEHQAILSSVLAASDDAAMSAARTMGVGVSLAGLIASSQVGGAGLLAASQTGSEDLSVKSLAKIAQDHIDAVEQTNSDARRLQLPVYLQARLYWLQLDRLRRHDFNMQKARAGSLTLLWQA
ncbi:MAG: squalene/phytoene synthase family protein, partial [Gammaproteobacteria bacterium]|nr:squalene/phytoene synthase family protein [Gammaproteobacteria bacterium]